MAGTEKAVMTSLRLPPALLQRVREEAERDRRTMAAEIAVLLEEAFAARDAATATKHVGERAARH